MTIAKQILTPGFMTGMSEVSGRHFKEIVDTEFNKTIPKPNNLKYVQIALNMAEIQKWQETTKHLNNPGEATVRANWRPWRDAMIDAAKKIKHCGADFLTIVSNTAHIFADDIEQASGIKLLHIATPTIDAIKKDGIDTVALLGTKYTMELDFYAGKLRDAGINVIIPADTDREKVHNIIFQELVHDIVNPESVKIYEQWQVRALSSCTPSRFACSSPTVVASVIL